MQWDEPPLGQGFLGYRDKYLVYTCREFLRAADSKSPEDRVTDTRLNHLYPMRSAAMGEFRSNVKQVDRKNFLYIEYLLRRGKKQLDQLKTLNTVGLSALNVSVSKADHPAH